MLAIALEGLAGASILVLWFPALAVWQIGLILVFGMTMLNLLSVRAFGESEFWLSGIKVAAIVVFIAIAAIAVGGDMVADKALPAPLYDYVDRTRVVLGKRVSFSVTIGGRLIII